MIATVKQDSHYHVGQDRQALYFLLCFIPVWLALTLICVDISFTACSSGFSPLFGTIGAMAVISTSLILGVGRLVAILDGQS